jgi:hypothetical protein
MTRLGVAGFAILMLGGCTDQMVSDHLLEVGPYEYMMGAPAPSDTNAPIRHLGPDKDTYPNLSVVPPRPTDVPTQAKIAADRKALEDARAANRAAADAVRGDPRLPPQPPEPTPEPQAQ